MRSPSALMAMMLTPIVILAWGLEVRATDPVPPMDASVALDAYKLAVEAHLAGVSAGTRALAATDEARSGDWERIRGPLAAFAADTFDQAAVWFARPDGAYWSVDKGETGLSLADRAYFPELRAGRDVVGTLVISKSTGRRSVIVASPVLVDGQMVGAIGVSLDATLLAQWLDEAIGFPSEVVFYALDADGRTALHRTGELIFEFPSDVGGETLQEAVQTMLSRPEGVVRYEFRGSRKTAVFSRSEMNGWVFVLGVPDGPAG